MKFTIVLYRRFEITVHHFIALCQRSAACFFLILLLIVSPFAYGDSFYDDAVRQFQENNPRDAAALFQASIRQGNNIPDVFIYLAYSYEQLGLYDQGITTLQDGLGFSRDKRHLFYFNLGNLYVHKQEFTEALEHYGLAIASKASYAEAYLNRANIRLAGRELDSSLEDYKTFIQVAPDHELVPDVRRMIEAIIGDIQSEETRKLEEARLATLEAERQKLVALEAEQRAREEEEQRKALLDSILGNLNDASDEGGTLGAGTEEISDEEDDFLRAE